MSCFLNVFASKDIKSIKLQSRPELFGAPYITYFKITMLATVLVYDITGT